MKVYISRKETKTSVLKNAKGQCIHPSHEVPEAWLHPWVRVVDPSLLLQKSATSLLPGSLLAWRDKFESSTLCKAKGSTAAVLDKKFGKDEFEAWMLTWLPPPALKLGRLSHQVTDMSWLFGFAKDQEFIDLEPGACGSLRLLMGGTLSIVCTPLSSLQHHAEHDFKVVEEVSSLMSQLHEEVAVYTVSYPLQPP